MEAITRPQICEYPKSSCGLCSPRGIEEATPCCSVSSSCEGKILKGVEIVLNIISQSNLPQTIRYPIPTNGCGFRGKGSEGMRMTRWRISRGVRVCSRAEPLDRYVVGNSATHRQLERSVVRARCKSDGLVSGEVLTVGVCCNVPCQHSLNHRLGYPSEIPRVIGELGHLRRECRSLCVRSRDTVALRISGCPCDRSVSKCRIDA